MVEIRDEVERRAIGTLVPYAKNSRTHSSDQIDQLAASMREWGWTTPILVDETGGIIAGHGRVLAAQRLGMQEVPVIVAKGWTEAQRRAYVIADNKLALNAGWDDAALALELGELQGMGFNLDLTGFDSDELLGLLEEKTENTGLTDDDEVGEPPGVSVTAAGNLWALGDHRLLCGDSTSSDQVASLMGVALADMLLTDPPYNADYVGKTKDALKIQNDKKGDAVFRQFLVDALGAAVSVMKPGAVFYIWHSDKEGYNFTNACRDVGLTVRQCLIWKKQTLVMGRQDYHSKHEPCLYGWKDGAGHLWSSDRKQTTILEFDRPTRSAEHPTMKPVALFEYQMLNNTKGADIVLDVFGGSGTTMIACEKHGRHARLMELDPKYCDVIIKRWQDFTGRQAVLESTGQTFEEVSAARG